MLKNNSFNVKYAQLNLMSDFNETNNDVTECKIFNKEEKNAFSPLHAHGTAA